MKASMQTLAVWFVFGMSISLAAQSSAGIGDSPLPVLVPGVATKHVYSVPGVTKFGNLETVFICTSDAPAPIRIGIEVFGGAGGLALNNVAGGASDLMPGATATLSTGVLNGAFSDVVIFGLNPFGNGSARILSTSTQVLCTAMVLDSLNSPPTSMTTLPIIKKTTQKGD